MYSLFPSLWSRVLITKPFIGTELKKAHDIELLFPAIQRILCDGIKLELFNVRLHEQFAVQVSDGVQIKPSKS